MHDSSSIAISVRNLTVNFNNDTILKNLSLDVFSQEILAFIGPSGSGKSVLLRSILGLNKKMQGEIYILGESIDVRDAEKRSFINQNIGVLFQQGALFSSLTALENVELPMRQYLDISPQMRRGLAKLKLNMVGLPATTESKFPAELSGGMVKRVALARALALDPKIVFLDEPTAGLDPISAHQFNELIKNLRDTMGLTVYMITHDLDSLYAICDRIAVLGNKCVKHQGTIEALRKLNDPWLETYFQSRPKF